MTVQLHELHRRRLETTVLLVEDGLARAEHLLRPDDRAGIVRAIENNLPEANRELLRGRIEELRAALGRFADDFGLEKRPLTLQQVLSAELASLWVMLENCRPKRMKGYGQSFSEEARTALEEALEGLLAQVKALQAAVR
jgi:hypothetical protein